MRGGAGLDPNQGRQLLEEHQDVAGLQLTADERPAFCSMPWNRKNDFAMSRPMVVTLD
jgi:hypothetical protein